MENNKEYQKWLEVVEKYGRRLRFVPEDLINKELCEVAVKDFPYVLQYVPEEFQAELAEKYDIPFPAKGQSR